MTRLLRVLILSVLVVGGALANAGGSPAYGVEPDEILDDPVLEDRAREISRELRCLVCRNESIDESNAPLARDLRVLVRERLVAGDTNTQVIEFVRDRYGDYVLLEPPLQSSTLALWLAPLAMLTVGCLLVFFVLRRQRQTMVLEGDDPQASDGPRASA